MKPSKSFPGNAKTGSRAKRYCWRLELVKKEIATLEEKTKQAESSVAEANKKRSELLAENDQLTAAGAQLTGAIAGMEGEIRQLFKQLPEPIQTKLQPLYQRVPENRPRPASPPPSGSKTFSASLTNSTRPTTK